MLVNIPEIFQIARRRGGGDQVKRQEKEEKVWQRGMTSDYARNQDPDWCLLRFSKMI